MNLLLATLAAPLATAGIGAIPGPRRPKEAAVPRRPRRHLRPRPGHRRAVPRGRDAGGVRRGAARGRPVGARPRPHRLRGPALGPLRRGVPRAQRAERLRVGEAADGAAGPRARLPRRDAARRGLEQPRRPLDRRRGDDARLRLPGGLPEPGHVARGGLEVPRPRQRRPRLRPARHGAAVRVGPGRPRRGDVGARLDAAPRPRERAAPLHREAGGGLPPHRLRHQGRPRPHAHLEAGRVPRGAVAGRRADGRGHDELLALRPPAGPPRVEGRPGAGVLGPAPPRPRARLRARRDAVHPDPVEPQAPARLLEHRARGDHGDRLRAGRRGGHPRGAPPHDLPHVRQAGRVLLRGHARPAPPLLRLRRDRRGHARPHPRRERPAAAGHADGDRLAALRPLLERDDDPEGRVLRAAPGRDRGLPRRPRGPLLRLLLPGGPAHAGRRTRGRPTDRVLPERLDLALGTTLVAAVLAVVSAFYLPAPLVALVRAAVRVVEGA